MGYIILSSIRLFSILLASLLLYSVIVIICILGKFPMALICNPRINNKTNQLTVITQLELA